MLIDAWNVPCRFVVTNCLDTEAEKALMRLLHAMSMMCVRSMTEQQRKAAYDRIISACTDFELHFPAYELDHKWHQVPHLASDCPFWFAAMWSFERMIRYLRGFIRNQGHPQASLVRHYRLWRSTHGFYTEHPQRFTVQLEVDVNADATSATAMPAYTVLR